MTSTLENLKVYCKTNNRICPMPMPWNELFNLLNNKKPKEPSVPLILAAWDSGALFKQLRFFEHLEWAEKQNQLEEISDFLYGLSEKDWFHLRG